MGAIQERTIKTMRTSNTGTVWGGQNGWIVQQFCHRSQTLDPEWLTQALIRAIHKGRGLNYMVLNQLTPTIWPQLMKV